jgi:tRNA dimethylallyltransferase
MLAQGFLDEVRALRALPQLQSHPAPLQLPALRADPRLHADLRATRAVGYRLAWRHLAGETDAATFRDQAIAATRQLAKRQLTWLRARPDLRWFDPARDEDRLEHAFRQFFDGTGASVE